MVTSWTPIEVSWRWRKVAAGIIRPTPPSGLDRLSVFLQEEQTQFLAVPSKYTGKI